MAQATTFPFSAMKVLLGDGASPETFSVFCGMNARSLNETKNFSEIDIPDCADEDAIAVVGREVRSTDWNISGEGVLADEAIDAIETFYSNPLSTNLQVILYDALDVARVTKSGRGHLSTKNWSANRGEKVTLSVEIVADGALVTVVA
jgi:hypothetical protein